MTQTTLRFFRYLENFNRPETFRKYPLYPKEVGTFNQELNELWNFLSETKLYPKFLLNCVSTFAAFCSVGLLCGLAR